MYAFEYPLYTQVAIHPRNNTCPDTLAEVIGRLFARDTSASDNENYKFLPSSPEDGSSLMYFAAVNH